MAEISLAGGCHTDGSIFEVPPWGLVGGVEGNCQSRIPATDPCRATVEADFYPKPIRIREANISNMPRDAVMYGSTTVQSYGRSNYTSPTGAAQQSAANCGKVSIANAGGFVDTYVFFDYVPNGLSFGLMLSDTWFSYLYKVGCNAGNVGTACYKYETESRSTSAGSDPNTGLPTAASTDSGGRCIPCTDYACTMDRLTIDYEVDEVDPKTVVDPDAPFPTLFAIDSDSQKVVFKYDALSSQLPNGVTDFNLVYTPDGIDIDAWDENLFSADPVVTSENHWQTSDEGFSTFFVIDGDPLESGNAQGLRLTIKISAVQDLSVLPTVTFTGTKWEILELVNPGQNYNVNDTFTITYNHIHADNTVSEFSIDLKVTAVGPIEITSNNGLDPLRSGDTINGHVITKMFHTDLENFNYHVAYLDGDGSDFTADGSYTSDRNHQITALAGFGIGDRAWYGGLYEFTQKSFQYTVHLRDPGAPNVFDTCKQPVFDYGCKATFSGGNQFTLSNSSDASKFQVGYTVKGPLIKPRSYVAAISGSTVTLNQDVDMGGISYSNYETDVQVQTITIEGGRVKSIEIVDGGQGLNEIEEIANKKIQLKCTCSTPDAVTREFIGTQVIPTDPPEYYPNVEGQPATENYGILKYKRIPAKRDNRPIIPQVTGTISNGVLTSVTIDDPGRGLNWGDDLVFKIPDTKKDIENVIIPAAEDSKPQWQGNIEEFAKSQGDVAAKEVDFQRRNRRQAGFDPDATNNFQAQILGSDFKQVEPKDNAVINYDPESQRRIQLPQQKYTKRVTDTIRESLRERKPINPADLAKEIGKLGESEVFRRLYDDFYESQTTGVEDAIDSMTQAVVPNYFTCNEALITTTQQRFGDLPHATDLVKYHMAQYRPDDRKETTVKINLRGYVVDEGCGHVPCANAPLAPSTAPNEVDPETGATTSYTYTLSPVLGPGCQSWVASGTQQIYNDLTRSAGLWAQTVAKYGNPFDITE